MEIDAWDILEYRRRCEIDYARKKTLRLGRVTRLRNLRIQNQKGCLLKIFSIIVSPMTAPTVQTIKNRMRMKQGSNDLPKPLGAPGIVVRNWVTVNKVATGIARSSGR
jgi:hypothetical protein